MDVRNGSHLADRKEKPGPCTCQDEEVDKRNRAEAGRAGILRRHYATPKLVEGLTNGPGRNEPWV